MIGSVRIFTYGVLLVMLVLLLVGGFGALLPTIFNWDTDLMFVALPVAALFVITATIAIVRRIVRMVRADIHKIQSSNH